MFTVACDKFHMSYRCYRHSEEGDTSSPGFWLCFSVYMLPAQSHPHLWLHLQPLFWYLSNSVFLNPEFQPSPEHRSHVLSEFQTEQVPTWIHYLLPQTLSFIPCVTVWLNHCLGLLKFETWQLPASASHPHVWVNPALSIGTLTCPLLSIHTAPFRPLSFLLAFWSFLSDLTYTNHFLHCCWTELSKG